VGKNNKAKTKQKCKQTQSSYGALLPPRVCEWVSECV